MGDVVKWYDSSIEAFLSRQNFRLRTLLTASRVNIRDGDAVSMLGSFYFENVLYDHAVAYHSLALRANPDHEFAIIGSSKSNLVVVPTRLPGVILGAQRGCRWAVAAKYRPKLDMLLQQRRLTQVSIIFGDSHDVGILGSRFRRTIASSSGCLHSRCGSFLSEGTNAHISRKFRLGQPAFSFSGPLFLNLCQLLLAAVYLSSHLISLAKVSLSPPPVSSRVRIG